MAYGKVVTGFSKPYVANYANNDGVVSYSNPTRLARGVEVSIEPEVSDASNFYADNIVAETVGGVFTGGKVTLTVDGLKQAAEKLIQGLPTAGLMALWLITISRAHRISERALLFALCRAA
jgi:hypothetical protein